MYYEDDFLEDDFLPKAPKKDTYNYHNMYNGISHWLYNNCKVPKDTQYQQGIHMIVKSYGSLHNLYKLSSIVKKISSNFNSFKEWAKQNYKQ